MTEKEKDPTLETPEDGGAKKPAPADGGENWERRFKGLQVSYDRLQAKYKTLEEERDRVQAELEEIRQTVRGHEGEKKSLADKITALEGEKTSLQNAANSHQQERERMRLIIDEFPELLKMEAKGLLPMGTTAEETRQKLTDYRDALKAMVGDRVLDEFRGTGPVGGGPKPPEKQSRDQMWLEASRLAGSRDPKERMRYEELMTELTKD